MGDGTVGDTPAMKKARVTPGDHAGPHNSFPITNGKDVADAAHLVGHAENPPAVKAKIIQIAHRIGETDRLPQEWKAGAQQTAHGGIPTHPLLHQDKTQDHHYAAERDANASRSDANTSRSK